MIKDLKNKKIQAMKDGDTLVKFVLSSIISDAELVAKNNRQEAPTDDQVVSVIKKHKKGVEQNLSLYQGEKKVEAQKEFDFLNSILPNELSKEELTYRIEEILVPHLFTLEWDSYSNGKIVGLVMAELKAKFPNQFDAKMASSIILEKIASP